MNKVQNLAIMASAGTGKTYSLAMRYITLLKLGAEPDEIIAMTFTNKAAGEIFDKIIQIMLNMMESPEELASAVRNGMLPDGTTRGDLTSILRKIFSMPGKLRISTFDSFFFKIIEAFPLECGIAGNISLINENDDTQRVSHLLHLLRFAPPEHRTVLLQLVKQLSFNEEHYSLFEDARALIENYYSEYLKYPDDELWAPRRFLNPEISEDDILPDEALRNIGSDLRQSSIRYTSKRFAQLVCKIADLADFAVQYTRFPTGLSGTVAEKLCEILGGDMSRSEIDIRYYSMFQINGMLLESCKEIIRHLAAVESRSMRARTSALHMLLKQFDAVYGCSVRSAGHLTFKDIPYLLKTDAAGSPFSDKLVLEERLDARYNHYLLDEFQDTSDEQWSILKNLIDEIFQPGQERFRSFFYVGDIKQSIYQWRGGDPKLFTTILDRYSDPGYDDASLHLKDLSKSYRSSRPVIRAVNRVFLHPERILSEPVGDAVREMKFHWHSSSASAAAQPGCAMLLEYAEDEITAESVLKLIDSLDPFSEEHDCSVGVLTLTNKFASEMAEDFCRLLISRHGLMQNFDVTLEGVLVLSGSPVYMIYRNLLILAEHPSDSMARGYLSMVSTRSGLHLMDLPSLYGENEKARSLQEWFEKIGNCIRRSVASDGFVPFLRGFIQILEPELTPSDSIRMDPVLDSALDFDSSGKKDIDEFIESLDRLEIKSSSVRKTVQFMTVHKSKGLDFDIVILPELIQKRNAIDKPVFTDKLFVEKDASFHPCWVSFPPKNILIPAFAMMKDVYQTMTGSKIYESCCQLYVAMTRARNALYMMIPKSGSGSYHFADFLKNTLTVEKVPLKTRWYVKLLLRNFSVDPLFVTGDPNWIRKKIVEKSSISPLIRSSRDAFLELAQRLYDGKTEVIPPKEVASVSPSNHSRPVILKTEKTGLGGAEFGTQLHELMSRIGYLEESDTECVFSEYVADSGLSGAVAEELASVFRNAVSSPDAASLLSRPGPFAELWREKKFIIQKDGQMISCVFDRVDVIRDPAGKVQKVRIVDYKSDNSDDPEYFRMNYGDQLAVYAEVLQRLFGIVPEKNIFILRSGKTLRLD